MNDARAKRIEVIALGGTIASTKRPGTEGVVPELNAAELIGSLPEYADISIGARNLANLPSVEIDLPLLFKLRSAIAECEREGVDGIVITQGTDTIEETAFALDILCAPDVPVIITGAMRNASQLGSDGPANLASAIACAADSDCRGRGVLVVLDDTIHTAAHVQKRDTSALDAFWSPSPLGRITEGVPSLFHSPQRRRTIRVDDNSDLPFVPILKAGLADPPTLVDAAIKAGAKGVVAELPGGGHASAAWADALEAAARNVPVIFASRTRGGRVLSSTYGQPGAEIDLIRRGLTGAGDLDALKARLVLCLLLIAGTPERFPEYADLSWRPER
ncbi:MAG: asparaginase [Rhizobiaceae bacterium]|nr:asparaginase [Rhizobiaceae bacterium]